MKLHKPMMQLVARECALCGKVDGDVRMDVVRWLDGSFDAIPRCTDRGVCRNRVEGEGAEWPVRDGHDLEAALRRRTA